MASVTTDRDAALRDALPAARGYARRLCAKSPVEAEDLVQSAVERALRYYDTHFDQTTNFQKWLLRIVHNLFVSETRNGLSRKRVAEERPYLYESFQASPMGDPQITSIFKDVAAFCDGLLPEYRALMAIAAEGECYADLAITMGLPVGTVRSRLSRTRALLREKFQWD